MDAVARALLAGGTLFVSEYISLFYSALVAEFDMEDPVRSESIYFLGAYVGPQNKRHIVLYIGIGRSHRELLRIARVDYTLPVPASGARVFGGDGSRVLPAEGPTFTYLPEPADPGFIDSAHAIAADIAASTARGPRDHIVLWDDEIARLEGLQRVETAELARLEAAAAAAAAAASSSSHRSSSSSNRSGSGSGSRSGSGSGSDSSSSSEEENPAIRAQKKRLETIHNALYFWRMMRREIMLQINRADIIMPGRATPRSPSNRRPRRFARRASTSNVRAPVASGSSDRTHLAHRRQTLQRRRQHLRRAAVTVRRRRAPGEPRVIPRDPVTGKIIRRRQAYSDPRATTTNIPESPARATSGRRSGYEGSNNTARGRSPEPTPNSNGNVPAPPNVFSTRGSA